MSSTALDLWLNGRGREEEGAGEAPLLSEHLQHLSASSIGMLYRCPRQFQRRYLFHEKERPGENLVVGSFFHKTISWNYAQKITSHADQPLDQIVQYMHDVSIPEVLEESGGQDEIVWDKGFNEAASDAARMTGAYYNTVVPRIQPIETEARFQLDFPGVEVPVIGYIDVEDAHRVIDSKTGKQVSRKVKPSWQLQGRLYSFAKRKPTEYHSISRAATPSIVTALESDNMTVPVPSMEQMANTTHLVQTAAELIRYFLGRYGLEQDWPTWGAIPDWSRNVLPCDLCGWRQGCPAWAGSTSP